MSVKAYMYHSFTKDNAGGNPAGVVLEAAGLSDNAMQRIAAELAFSETAFLFPGVQTDYHVRYFTPVEEVAICGHATIALFTCLFEKQQVNIGTHMIQTKAGQLNVRIETNGQIYLEQTPPQFLSVLPLAEITSSLAVDSSALHPELPIQIVSTGLKDILIPISSLETLTRIQPNFDAVTAVSQKYQVTGYHLFSLEVLTEGYAAHCRNLAPLFDIPEESATGTANAALACYLANYLPVYQQKSKLSLLFEQGYSMGQPSEIRVALTRTSNQIAEVYVGGAAMYAGSAVVSLH